MTIKKHLVEWKYDILYFAVVMGIIAGIWIWNSMDRTKEVRRWIQNLDEEKMVVTTGSNNYTLSVPEKKEMLQLLKTIKEDDVELLGVTDPRSGGIDYSFKISIGNKTYWLGHSYIVSGDAMIEYKGDDYWINCEGLKEFLKQIYEKAETTEV